MAPLGRSRPCATPARISSVPTPTRGGPSVWPGASGPFAAPMNEIPKVVFSKSLTSADWGETTIANGDLDEAVTRLKQERSNGYLLAQGGTRFARSLVETGLIDEFRLVVHPVVLGAGERLFDAPLAIEPISTTCVFSRGATLPTSSPRTPDRAPSANRGAGAFASARLDDSHAEHLRDVEQELGGDVGILGHHLAQRALAQAEGLRTRKSPRGVHDRACADARCSEVRHPSPNTSPVRITPTTLSPSRASSVPSRTTKMFRATPPFFSTRSPLAHSITLLRARQRSTSSSVKPWKTEISWFHVLDLVHGRPQVQRVVVLAGHEQAHHRTPPPPVKICATQSGRLAGGGAGAHADQRLRTLGEHDQRDEVSRFRGVDVLRGVARASTPARGYSDGRCEFARTQTGCARRARARLRCRRSINSSMRPLPRR